MLCQDKFLEIYKQMPDAVSFCPYRICPIGAHVDHNHGKVTGFALDKGINIAYKPKHNGVVELCSLQFPKRAQWHVRAVPEHKQDDWADYLRGVTIQLSQMYPLSVGLSGVIEGSLPIGGLSSSAAVCISFLQALCMVNNIKLTASEIISIAKTAENKYVGVSCGTLDQSCEVYCRKDHLLFLDTATDEYELIPASPDMGPYEIAIFFSGLERSLVGSQFNMRVDECHAAAYALKAFAGLEYGKFQEVCLRDVPFEVFEAEKSRLPEPWRLRAEHFFSETARAESAAEAWRRGDIAEYGRLSFESGNSSIHNFQTGSAELIKLYEILTRTEGVYGGRFSGAGFKGCCMALIDPAYRESVLENVRAQYVKAFPALESNYRSVICRSADGVSIL